jgi:hypothetical protein
MEYELILNYQAIQRERGSMRVNIENKINADEKAFLLKEFRKYFKNDINLEVVDNVNLYQHEKKKIDFVSEL